MPVRSSPPSRKKKREAATAPARGAAVSPKSPRASGARRPVFLVTAGPTYEDIDAVRFIGNRSSGRMGVAIARAAARRGCEAILLLGPGSVVPPRAAKGFAIERFRSCDDLEALLGRYWPSRADVLVMAAAVADYRPAGGTPAGGKIARSAADLTLRLESTPDLVAACAARSGPGRLVIGFALEAPDGLAARAAAKLRRKGLDAIVANPLETMESHAVEATLLWAGGEGESPGRVSKEYFARWLVEKVTARLEMPKKRD